MAAALRLHLSELNKLVTCCLCNRLMKLATCLSCNHHFCMACILEFTSEEYTFETGTRCPKCHLPAVRCQAIYSPEFDKFVEIYKGLELGLDCLRLCCEETYRNLKKQEQGTTKKAKKKRRREKEDDVSLNESLPCVVEREKEDDLSLNESLPCVVKKEKEAAVVSLNERSSCALEGGKEASVVSLDERPSCALEGETEAAVVSLIERSLCLLEGEKEAVIVSFNQRSPPVVQGVKEAAVVSLYQRSACVAEGSKNTAAASLNWRSPSVMEREKEAAVVSLNKRSPRFMVGEKEAAVVSVNQSSPCAMEGGKEAVVSVKQRSPCVSEGEKEAAVVLLNQRSPCVVKGQKEATDGEKEADVVSLNEMSLKGMEGEKEVVVLSLIQKSPCVVEEEKEASGDGVEDPHICASKKKRKKKRKDPYRLHPPMSKRVQLPCPISGALEEHEENVSLAQKTWPLHSEVLRENAHLNKEGLPVVSDGTIDGCCVPETAVTKMENDRLCLPYEDEKGNQVIGFIVGIMAKQDHTGSSPASNHGNDMAECKPKQKTLVLDQLPCVFCQVPNDSVVAGPMMQYEKGVPVQAGRRIKCLVSVHQHCAEWAPNVYYVGDIVKNLNEEVGRGQKLKCSDCGLKGAVLGCFVKHCTKSYHYPCAQSLSCRWDRINYVVLCPEHVVKSLPCDEAKSKKIKNKSKATSKKLAQLVKSGQNKLDRSGPVNISENQALRTEECKAEKPAAEDIVPSCKKTTRIFSGKWTSLVACELFLCGSGLDSKLQDLLVSFMNETGARVTRSWDPRVTHLIIATDAVGAASRTLKFMLATLAGTWILKSDWLEECMAACQLVREEPYEVTRDIHGLVGGPARARLVAASRTNKLFVNIEFYFLGDFTATYKMDLQVLVGAAGGRIQEDSWNAEEIQTCARIIVYNAGMTPRSECQEAIKSRWLQAKSVANKAKAFVVAHTWLLDSIAAYELQPLN